MRIMRFTDARSPRRCAVTESDVSRRPKSAGSAGIQVASARRKVLVIMGKRANDSPRTRKLSSEQVTARVAMGRLQFVDALAGKPTRGWAKHIPGPQHAPGSYEHNDDVAYRRQGLLPVPPPAWPCNARPSAAGRQSERTSGLPGKEKNKRNVSPPHGGQTSARPARCQRPNSRPAPRAAPHRQVRPRRPLSPAGRSSRGGNTGVKQLVIGNGHWSLVDQ